MPYIKLTADEALMEEIRDFYEAPSYPNKKNPYLVFQATTLDNLQVTAYKSKELYTIMFSGEKNKLINEASIFIDDPIVIEENENTVEDFKDLAYQIGTDEVGVGDVFGPLVVVASYVTPKDIETIMKLGIKDSKKLTDTKILEIGPQISKIFPHVVCLCSPSKLSTLKDNGWNMHKIMANLHNTAQNNLLKKIKVHPNTVIYVDEFASKDLYFKYLVTPFPTPYPLHFETKGESHFPSVAVSSILARYHFLKKFEEIEKTFKIQIPKGAGEEVDKVIKALVKQYGLDSVKEYTKTFFRNIRDYDE